VGDEKIRISSFSSTILAWHVNSLVQSYEFVALFGVTATASDHVVSPLDTCLFVQ
jgi:hypothetical protein